MKMKPGSFMLLIFWGIFSIPLLITILMFVNRINLVTNWEKSTGLVLKNIHSSITSSGYTTDNLGNKKYTESTSWFYYPEISFTTSSGERKTFISKKGTSKVRFDVEDSVDIYYNPKSPSEARIATFSYIWGWPVGFGSIVISLMTIFGIPIMIIRKKIAYGAPGPDELKRDIMRRGKIVTRLNTEKIKEEVNEIIDLFLLASSELDYGTAKDLMGADAIAGMPEDNFIKYNTNINNQLGEYIRRSQTYSKMSSDQDGNIKCSIDFECIYDRGTTIMGFRLVKSFDRWRITGYNLNIKK